jgi:hypothetical protein
MCVHNPLSAKTQNRKGFSGFTKGSGLHNNLLHPTSSVGWMYSFCFKKGVHEAIPALVIRRSIFESAELVAGCSSLFNPFHWLSVTKSAGEVKV